MSMTLIETKTLASAAASIEFTSIPQTYTDLVALVSCQGTSGNASSSTCQISLNSSSTGFSTRRLRGSSTAVDSVSTTDGWVMFIPNSLTNAFGNGLVYFPNYAGSTNKTFSCDSVTEFNGSLAQQVILAGLWSNTAAITTLKFTISINLFATGSTISLYGITKGSSGGVVVS